MERIASLIQGIEQKILILTERYQEAQNSRKQQEQRIQAFQQTIAEQNKKIDELETIIKTLNISKSIVSIQDIPEAKQKIGELVREIDRCIGLLQNKGLSD